MKDNRMCRKSKDTEAPISFSTFSFSWKFLHGVWQKLVIILDNHQDLQVWHRVDRHGHTYWKAYDPVTGKSFSSGSEADICVWIEQRYR